MPPAIALINPPTTPYDRDETYFPMALVCLGSALRERGHDVAIVDFDLQIKARPDLTDWDAFARHAVAELEKTGSRVFGISSICSNYPVSLLIAREIRRRWPDAKIVLGGPQPSAVAEETLKTHPAVDAVVVGEGEETLAELMDGDWTEETLARVNGLVFRQGGVPRRTAPRTLIADLDRLPFPDFSLIPLKDYLAIYPGTPLIEAGRGCPFLCSFCSTSLMWEREFRAKTPARVLEEMRRLRSLHGLKDFSLTHDNFTTSHRYTAEFGDFFRTHNDEGFTWSVSARPDTVNAERLATLRAGGCSGLFYGVDSGSERIQKVMKKNLNIDRLKDVIREAIGLGMAVTTSFVVGFPEETEDDLDRTLALGLSSKLEGADIVQFHPLAPLAGTSIQRDNRDRFTWDPAAADLSFHPVRSAEIDRMIGEQPELFSFFYAVPTPHLPGVSLVALAVFFDELVNHMAPYLKRLLDGTRWSPVELFRRWDAWRRDAQPSRVIDGDFVRQTLPAFLEDSLSKMSAA